MNPQCSQFQYQELLYLYNELVPEKRLRFEAHLKSCSSCQQRLKEAQGVIKQFKPGSLTPSKQSFELIRSKIREQSKLLVPIRLSGLRWVRWAGVAVAAGVCLVILSQILVKPPVEDNPVAPYSEQLEHSAFVWDNGNYSELDSLALGIRALELGWDEAAVDVFDAEDSLDEINQLIKQLRKEL